MKIFFNTSVTGRRLYMDNYKKIYATLLDSGNEVSTFAFESSKEKIIKETPEQYEHYYRRLVAAIKTAEVGFFEVSYPSLGIGFEIAQFMEQRKPVVALYVLGRRSYILESINNEKLFLVEYRLPEVKKLVEKYLMYTQELLETRFTMLMPNKLTTFLSEVSEKSGVSRSEFIRELIREKMGIRRK